MSVLRHHDVDQLNSHDYQHGLDAEILNDYTRSYPGRDNLENSSHRQEYKALDREIQCHLT